MCSTQLETVTLSYREIYIRRGGMGKVNVVVEKVEVKIGKRYRERRKGWR